jgi:hypothetical protein
MNPQQTIENFFADTNILVKGKSYHSPLPADITPWHCYTIDGGHSILALIDGQFHADDPALWESLCPFPVKTVLRGYRAHCGFVVATTGFNYDEEIGLVTDPEDNEF